MRLRYVLILVEVVHLLNQNLTERILSDSHVSKYILFLAYPGQNVIQPDPLYINVYKMKINKNKKILKEKKRTERYQFHVVITAVCKLNKLDVLMYLNSMASMPFINKHTYTNTSTVENITHGLINLSMKGKRSKNNKRLKKKIEFSLSKYRQVKALPGNLLKFV